jgi:hypothetical protein
MASGVIENKKVLYSLELFATEVMPQFKDCLWFGVLRRRKLCPPGGAGHGRQALQKKNSV